MEDCPHFIFGCCQEYLDGDCSAHRCDLKIIRELKEKLQTKEQECERLKEWQEANQPTGICETCTAKSVEDMYRNKKALDEIEEFCLVCRENPIEGTVYDKILDIINKAKEG